MKVVLGLVLALAVLACVAQASDSDVVVLTNDNFDEVVKSNDYVLVEFFVRLYIRPCLNYRLYAHSVLNSLLEGRKSTLMQDDSVVLILFAFSNHPPCLYLSRPPGAVTARSWPPNTSSPPLPSRVLPCLPPSIALSRRPSPLASVSKASPPSSSSSTFSCRFAPHGAKSMQVEVGRSKEVGFCHQISIWSPIHHLLPPQFRLFSPNFAICSQASGLFF